MHLKSINIFIILYVEEKSQVGAISRERKEPYCTICAVRINLSKLFLEVSKLYDITYVVIMGFNSYFK